MAQRLVALTVLPENPVWFPASTCSPQPSLSPAPSTCTRHTWCADTQAVKTPTHIKNFKVFKKKKRRRNKRTTAQEELTERRQVGPENAHFNVVFRQNLGSPEESTELRREPLACSLCQSHKASGLSLLNLSSNFSTDLKCYHPFFPLGLLIPSKLFARL